MSTNDAPKGAVDSVRLAAAFRGNDQARGRLVACARTVTAALEAEQIERKKHNGNGHSRPAISILSTEDHERDLIDQSLLFGSVS